MRVLFPSQPFEPRSVDSMFALERQAAEAAGLGTALLDVDALDQGDHLQAVRRVEPSAPGETVIYRGWMLPAESYASLHAALARRGLVLINSPAQYRHAHHLPESYEVIRSHTPRTVWTTGGATYDQAEVQRLLEPFADAPLIVKDYVKSQKHAWAEACYIPRASDIAHVTRVATRFIELQGAQLTGGLVFREFVELAPLTQHSRSGMPLTQEFRIFFLEQRPLVWAAYWEEGEYPEHEPPLAEFAELGQRVQSRFFTMDVARKLTGEWVVMELGDGQVAGIPERLSAQRFYQALAACEAPSSKA